MLYHFALNQKSSRYHRSGTLVLSRVHPSYGLASSDQASWVKISKGSNHHSKRRNPIRTSAQLPTDFWYRLHRDSCLWWYCMPTQLESCSSRNSSISPHRAQGMCRAGRTDWWRTGYHCSERSLICPTTAPFGTWWEAFVVPFWTFYCCDSKSPTSGRLSQAWLGLFYPHRWALFRTFSWRSSSPLWSWLGRQTLSRASTADHSSASYRNQSHGSLQTGICRTSLAGSRRQTGS